MKNISLITTYTIVCAASAYALLAIYMQIFIFLISIANVK